MISENDIRSVTGAAVHTQDGDKIGSVGEVYLDDQTGVPSWVTVNTGWFGTATSFIPLDDATMNDGALMVPYSKDKVTGAPRVAADGHLNPDEEAELYRYYGRDYGHVEHSGRHDVVDAPAAPVVDDAGSMTRSEERLAVGKESVEAGRVRLRKYVVTEEQTVTVPVKKEVLSIQRETIADGETAPGGIIEGDSVEEVVLREERAVVDKETVAVEKVNIGKEEVVEQQTVRENIRKEQIDIEDDGTRH